MNVNLEKKFETFTNKIVTLKRSLDDKEKEILALETRLNEKQNYVNEKLKEIESKLKVKEQSVFKCEECNFSSLSEQGLKTHNKRKHMKTSKQADNYPVKKKLKVK